MKTEYLLSKEVSHILAALTPSNRIVCEVSLHTGLRISDVLNLKTDQLKSIFYVTESKTGKKRRIGLPKHLLDAVRANAGVFWAFPHRTNENYHRTRQAVWKDVKRASVAFRLKQNVAPHSFRKVYAVELRKKYGDIERVRRALNHESETTTMIYAMADALLDAKKARKKTKSAK